MPGALVIMVDGRRPLRNLYCRPTVTKAGGLDAVTALQYLQGMVEQDGLTMAFMVKPMAASPHLLSRVVVAVTLIPEAGVATAAALSELRVMEL